MHPQFESVDHAVACREAIFDVVWPVQVGRRLSAEFASAEEAQAAASGVPLAQKKNEEGGRRQEAKAKVRGGQQVAEAPKEKPKTLDDLFRSTKTEPRLYWLPADGSLHDTA